MDIKRLFNLLPSWFLITTALSSTTKRATVVCRGDGRVTESHMSEGQLMSLSVWAHSAVNSGIISVWDQQDNVFVDNFRNIGRGAWELKSSLRNLSSPCLIKSGNGWLYLQTWSAPIRRTVGRNPTQQPRVSDLQWMRWTRVSRLLLGIYTQRWKTCPRLVNALVLIGQGQEMLKMEKCYHEVRLFLPNTCCNRGPQNLISICWFSKNIKDSQEGLQMHEWMLVSGDCWLLASKPAHNVRIWHISSLKITQCGMRLCNRQRKQGKCSKVRSASQASGKKTFQKNVVGLGTEVWPQLITVLNFK